jgi:hypothetical protein
MMASSVICGMARSVVASRQPRAAAVSPQIRVGYVCASQARGGQMRHFVKVGGLRSAPCRSPNILVGSRAEGTTPPSLFHSVAAGGARWWRFQRRAEERSCRGRARSALRKHFHRGCLSVAPAGRAASSAMRPGGEHRRSVGAFSARPRRCEPPPGTACRDARQSQGSSTPTSETSQRPGSSAVPSEAPPLIQTWRSHPPPRSASPWSSAG